MKSIVFVIYFLVMLFALPALAVEVNSCAAKSAQLKLSERSAYMKSCLAQASSPANVKEAELQHKRALCEQNAKNYKLQGNSRANYIPTCINKNEAVAAVMKSPAKATAMADNSKGKHKKGASRAASAQVRADAEGKSKAKPRSKAKVLHESKHEPGVE